jgi:hypothetical protein
LCLARFEVACSEVMNTLTGHNEAAECWGKSVRIRVMKKSAHLWMLTDEHCQVFTHLPKYLVLSLVARSQPMIVGAREREVNCISSGLAPW